jgi:hypothetical protein
MHRDVEPQQKPLIRYFSVLHFLFFKECAL